MLDRLFGNAFMAQAGGELLADDNDTKALLYGPQFGSSPLSFDETKDIRMVIICDNNMLEDFIFDSHRLAMKSNSMENLAGATNVTSPPPSHRSSASSTPSPLSYIISSSMQSPDPVSLNLLKEIAFGSTPMRFNQNITKLHPLPASKTSNQRMWLVSRLFKVGDGTGSAMGSPSESTPHSRSVGTGPATPDLQSPSTTRGAHLHLHLHQHHSQHQSATTPPLLQSQGSNTPPESPLRSGPATRESTIEDPPDEPVWSPRPAVKTAAHTLSSGRDIRCTICLVFTFSSESQNLLTNHWDELSHALAEFQNIVYARLSETLPQALQEYRFRSTTPLESSRFIRRYSLQDDEAVAKACHSFRSRFFNIIRVPRVICGQDRWADLYKHLHWGIYYLEGSADNIAFISTMIAAFIIMNRDIIHDLNSLTHRSRPARTVVMTSNPVVARKLVFILSSLLRDSTSQRLLKIADEHVFGFSKTSSFSAPPESSAGVGTNAKFSFREGGGWEIPVADSQTGQSQAIAMPHVIRPSFSSASLSNSLARSTNSTSSQSRFPSFGSLRKSFATSASSGASYISHLLSPSESSFTDDVFEPSSFSDRPGVTRWLSQERTATTVNPVMRNLSSINLSSHDISDDDFHSPSRFRCSTPNYTLEDSVLDVDMLSDDEDGCFNTVPIVLPPVVGFVAEYHPDFVLQACPVTRDLEGKISTSMNLDADIVPSGWVERGFKQRNSSQTVEELSKTLIVNVKRKELYEWTLVRTCTSQGCQQQLQQKKIFGNKKPISECDLMSGKVESAMRRIFEGATPGIGTKSEAIQQLRESYLSLFNLLD